MLDPYNDNELVIKVRATDGMLPYQIRTWPEGTYQAIVEAQVRVRFDHRPEAHEVEEAAKAFLNSKLR